MRAVGLKCVSVSARKKEYVSFQYYSYWDAYINDNEWLQISRQSDFDIESFPVVRSVRLLPSYRKNQGI